MVLLICVVTYVLTMSMLYAILQKHYYAISFGEHLELWSGTEDGNAILQMDWSSSPNVGGAGTVLVSEVYKIGRSPGGNVVIQDTSGKWYELSRIDDLWKVSMLPDVPQEGVDVDNVTMLYVLHVLKHAWYVFVFHAGIVALFGIALIKKYG
jgi:hypothetical protein